MRLGGTAGSVLQLFDLSSCMRKHYVPSPAGLDFVSWMRRLDAVSPSLRQRLSPNAQDCLTGPAAVGERYTLVQVRVPAGLQLCCCNLPAAVYTGGLLVETCRSLWACVA
jgi:hypothetical protein